MLNQDLRFRRRVQTVGEPPAKNKFTIILATATAAIIVPALIYTAMHPTNVSSKMLQIAHMPMQVKDIRIAVIAARPTPTTDAALTPVLQSAKASRAAKLAHLAHLKRAHALAAAAAARHANELASNGQTSDITSSTTIPSTITPSTVTPSTVTRSTVTRSTVTPPTSTGSTDTVATTTDSTTSVTSRATATPATVAEAPAPSQPVADATPVYAPEIVVDAHFTREVHPDYPEIAKEQGAQGTAIVMATIGPNGNVLAARIDQSTGNKLLDGAALTAARESGFAPPKINGRPATETYRLVYTFAL